MAQIAKFHKKAIAIFGCAQTAENIPVVNDTPTGTITTTTSASTVTGVSTKFLTELAVGSYIYNGAGAVCGRVLSVASDTAATLESNGSVAITGAVFKIGLGPKNALACLNLNFVVETASEAFEYVGDELNRDEQTIITDKFGKLDFETFLPVKGTTSSTPIPQEIPLSDWLQACGFAIVLSSGKYAATNSLASNSFMTIEFRLSSPDLLTTQKTYTITNTRGSIDFDCVVGTKPKLKFNLMGNILAPSSGTISVEKAKIIPDFQYQKASLSEAIKSNTVNLTQLAPYAIAPPTSATVSATSGSTTLVVSAVAGIIVTGSTVTGTGIAANTTITGQISGTVGGIGSYTLSNATTAIVSAVSISLPIDGEPSTPTISTTTTPSTITGGLTNITFSKIAAPNINGFDYNRFLTSAVDGWSKGGKATDLTITGVEDVSASSYNPENMLEVNHKLTLNYSDINDTANKVVTIVFRKIQLTKVSPSDVGSFRGQDLLFKNRGYTDIIFS